MGAVNMGRSSKGQWRATSLSWGPEESHKLVMRASGEPQACHGGWHILPGTSKLSKYRHASLNNIDLRNEALDNVVQTSYSELTQT